MRRDHLIPTVFTLSLHLIVVVAVLAGWQMNDSKRFRVETPPYVRATLVNLESVTAKPAVTVNVPQPAPAASVQPPKAIERKSTPKPKASAAPKDIAISKPEKTRPEKPPAETKPSKPEPKPEPKKTARPEPKPKPKTVNTPEPAPAEPVETASAAAAEAQRVKAQRDEMMAALADEEALMAAEEGAATAASYAALIKDRVEGRWSRPPSARKDMQVVLSIRMIPTGDVIGVEVLRSSGNAAFDRSAVAAVERVERFPELSEMPPSVFDTYFREFTLVFKPEDLLL